jgi:hypothetical protein
VGGHFRLAGVAEALVEEAFQFVRRRTAFHGQGPFRLYVRLSSLTSSRP